MEGENTKPMKPSVAGEYKGVNLPEKWDRELGKCKGKPAKPTVAREYERTDLLEKRDSAKKSKSEAKSKYNETYAEITQLKDEHESCGNKEMRDAKRKRAEELQPTLKARKEDFLAKKAEWKEWKKQVTDMNKEIHEAPNDPETEESD